MNAPYVNMLKIGADALMAQGALHFQLMQVEWELEKLRFRRIFYLLLIGIPLLICSLLAVGMLVMMLSWSLPIKNTVACVLVLVYGTGALFAVYRLQKVISPGVPAFAGTRREIAIEVALWRSRLGA